MCERDASQASTQLSITFCTVNNKSWVGGLGTRLLSLVGGRPGNKATQLGGWEAWKQGYSAWWVGGLGTRLLSLVGGRPGNKATQLGGWEAWNKATQSGVMLLTAGCRRGILKYREILARSFVI